jgi:hypothetical protein
VSGRNPARRGRADGNHAAVKLALEAIGIQAMDLSAAGNGVEDLLLPLARRGERWWLLVEVKVARNKRGEVTQSQYTKAQREWRERTAGWPRITVTSGQDAVDQVRALTG